ncbi:hypothetical protein WICPIJ_005698 [Wickerhamomyces pijperi]|uniref:Mitochondrial outer membrane transport complex Sam37/metaxin N-terminal domain-containing protein n=1 Tax=Wickerhamomyces pijperi TaxID=599730 RepID=A0A9P8TM39_WICPI|nr:hypothetical protein WICPIJ_005698 [Wickerhamomyces pijperi]
MELHVWGNKDEFAIIDPESIASIWLLNELLDKSNFTVVPSSNNKLSPTGKLPVLLQNGQVIDGYQNIVQYLATTQGLSLDSELTPQEQAFNQSLTIFAQTELSLITNYSLYLNKENYEKYTRGIFSHYLAFPLQYNTPISLRSLAKTKCLEIGLIVEDKSDLEEDMLKSIPTISSKIRKMKNDQMIEYKLLMKNSKTNFKCLNYVQSNLIDFLNGLRTELNNSNKTKTNIDNAIEILPIFQKSDKVFSSGELLILAYLNTLLSPKLPDQFINDYIKVSVDSTNLQFITKEIQRLNEGLKSVSTRKPKFWGESANILNSF